MWQKIIPKLPMRQKHLTTTFYNQQLGFQIEGDYPDYVVFTIQNQEIHFFLYPDLDVHVNYGQVYIRTDDIQCLYESLMINNVAIHPNGSLSLKPWGQKEFSILDPDNNLLTFGQRVEK